MRKSERLLVELMEALRDEAAEDVAQQMFSQLKSLKKPSAGARSPAFHEAKRALTSASRDDSWPGKPGPKPKPKLEVKGKKRPAQIADEALEYIKKNPGAKAGPMADHIGIARVDLAWPLKILKNRDAIAIKGIKTQTTYTAKA